MAAEQATLISSADITWAGGTLFNGYVMLIMALPSLSGSAWGSVRLKDTVPVLRVPTRIKVPIREGQYDEGTKVWRTDSLVPPQTKYAYFFYDSTDRLLSIGGSLFTVTTDEHTLDPGAAFTDPTASVTVPDPEDVPESGSTAVVHGGPTLENLSGTKNGINTSFTISADGSVVMIIWNQNILTEGVEYTKSGVDIEMVIAPDANDTLRAIIW